ncbi:MAG: BatD family protein [Acidobacteriota bacterium]|nr:BatD family protein [Acidobacteriota bacterium]MDH3785887.1 BatD family protein [Acidobacteriota bacterium]
MGWMRVVIAWFVVVLTATSLVGAETGVSIAVEPESIAVGDPLSVTVTITLPSGTTFDPPPSSNALGPFEVVESSWTPSSATAEDQVVWVWNATIRVFRTGEHVIPELTFSYGDGGEGFLQVAETLVQVTSVVDGEEWDTGEPEKADLKAPASISPDYTALWIAGGILFLLLLVALVIWYVQRRYGQKLVAVEMPTDPFQRMAPHEWVYQELQRLLDQRLPENGRIDLFYAELSRIVKWYVSGRYRVDLMERTTAEVRPGLADVGAPDAAVSDLVEILQEADRVKFARSRPDSDACKQSIEAVYRLVDQTRPQAVRQEEAS